MGRQQKGNDAQKVIRMDASCSSARDFLGLIKAVEVLSLVAEAKVAEWLNSK